MTYLDDYLTADVVEQSAQLINEQPEKTRAALDTLNSVLLAGFIKRCSNEIGANLLFNTIRKGNYEQTSTGDLLDLLRNREAANAFITAGSNTISQLMPDKRSPITVLVSSYARIRNSSATTLLGLVTPLFMEGLARQVKSRNLDATGLATFLADQKEALIERTPADLLERMRSTLGIDNLAALGQVPVMSAGREARPARMEAVEMEYRERRPLPWGAILGGALLVGLLAGGYWVWQQYGDQWQSAANTEEITDSTALSTTAGANGLAVGPDSAMAIRTAAPAAAGSGVPAQLAAYLADPTAATGKAFAMTDLRFDPATFALVPASAQQVAEVGKVLKTYPGAQLRITGITGQASQKSVAFKRANSVKAALMKEGIDLMRLDAVSLVRPDSAGRLGDRISLRVVKR
jgi:outer membrane protein OmpA-like peptidoglycan-associated protein